MLIKIICSFSVWKVLNSETIVTGKWFICVVCAYVACVACVCVRCLHSASVLSDSDSSGWCCRERLRTGGAHLRCSSWVWAFCFRNLLLALRAVVFLPHNIWVVAIASKESALTFPIIDKRTNTNCTCICAFCFLSVWFTTTLVFCSKYLYNWYYRPTML